jgi:zinc/manganese transport system permease protein
VWCSRPRSGLGVLFISLYSGYATATYSILFGQVLGVSWRDLGITIALAVVVVALIAWIARPLIFVSVEEGAEARGLSARALSLTFALIVALCVVIAVQVVGVLLIFALLVAPAATADLWGRRPAQTVALSVTIALVSGVGGLLIGALWKGPISFWVTSLGAAAYGLSRLAVVRRRTQLVG